MAFIKFNANPQHSRVGDCTVRAISKRTGQSWDSIYIRLCLYGLIFADMPSANVVWGEYLIQHNFIKNAINNGNNYTVIDFCNDNPRGIYILALPNHVLCVIDGNYYDTWDSGDEIPFYYFFKNKQ